MGMPQARFHDLDGAGVVITGGASGIGAALVEGFAAQGCQVGFIDIDRDAADDLVGRLGGLYPHAPVFRAADLRDVSATRQAIDAMASSLGPIRVLINNAGWDDRHDILGVTEDYWDKSLSINLKPVVFVTQAVVPHMRKAGGGAIINFSSIAYMMNLPDLAAYGAAKAGIIGLTKSLAGRLGGENIRVNAVLPGMVLTERQKRLWINDAAAKVHRDRQCLDFSLVAEDMVGPCLFLASDCARAITAQSIIVDGGYF